MLAFLAVAENNNKYDMGCRACSIGASMMYMGQKLGQHFLINMEKLQKVADALEIKTGDVVIEIGPGHGELTQYLLEVGARVTALERDKSLIEPLKEKFDENNFEVIEGNALELLPMVVEELERDGKLYMIAGNIPYYITGFLLRTIEELNHKPTRVVLTIQKEVAERICATVPRMNLLAASVQYWAKASIIEIVPKADFDPPPKVDSATIRLEVQPPEGDSDRYYAFIKKLFTQPGKTIANNLAGKDGDKDAVAKKLQIIGIDAQKRPHDLTVQDIQMMEKAYE